MLTHNLQLLWSIGFWEEVKFVLKIYFNVKIPPSYYDHTLSTVIIIWTNLIYFTQVFFHLGYIFFRQFDFKRISLFLWNIWCHLWLYPTSWDHDFYQFESDLPNHEYAFMQVAVFGAKWILRRRVRDRGGRQIIKFYLKYDPTPPKATT